MRLVFALLLLAGCSQQAGDRCQTDGDCDTGLKCVLDTNGAVQSAQVGGHCAPPNIDAGVVDLTTHD